MTDVVKLTVMKSMLDNRKLTPNADGYYTVILGAFNVYNSAGMAYSFKGVPEILNDKDAILNKRLMKGRLRSEVDHPRVETGMSNNKIILRNLDIPLANTCAHIKEIHIKETSMNEGIPGMGNVVLVEGLVKPSGPSADALKMSLDNASEDTCFSIRCFTRDKAENGIIVKYVTQIVTWDWVNEPGIKYASKLDKIQVESIDLGSYALEELGNSDGVAHCLNCSVENTDQTEILTELITRHEDVDIVSSWGS